MEEIYGGTEREIRRARGRKLELRALAFTFLFIHIPHVSFFYDKLKIGETIDLPSEHIGSLCGSPTIHLSYPYESKCAG